MAEKDKITKLLEDYPEVFADIINVLLFHGERLIDPDNISDGPTVSRYKDADERIREHIRDTVKYDKKNATLAIIGIENQSTADKEMVFRVMGYDFSSYQKQMDERVNPKNPVITLVLHFGMKKWEVPKDVLSAVNQDLPYKKYLPEIISNPHINVVDVAFLPLEIRQQFTSDFRIVADYFSAVRENRVMDIRMDKRQIEHIGEILDFFAIFGKDKRFVECKPIILEESKKGAVTMCKVMDFAMEQGKEQGILEGIKIGREEGRKEGRKEGKYFQLYELTKNGIITMETAAKSANLSVEEFLSKLKEFKIV